MMAYKTCDIIYDVMKTDIIIQRKEWVTYDIIGDYHIWYTMIICDIMDINIIIIDVIV